MLFLFLTALVWWAIAVAAIAWIQYRKQLRAIEQITIDADAARAAFIAEHHAFMAKIREA